jgi:hypothetical protein
MALRQTTKTVKNVRVVGVLCSCWWMKQASAMSVPHAYKELSGALPGGTNNQAELEAVRQVLLAMKRDGITITIHTDSKYVIGVLAHHWKPKQNVALIADIKQLLAKHTVTFEKVAGHAGVNSMNALTSLPKPPYLSLHKFTPPFGVVFYFRAHAHPYAGECLLMRPCRRIFCAPVWGALVAVGDLPHYEAQDISAH